MNPSHPENPSPPRRIDPQDPDVEASLRHLAGRTGHQPPTLGPSDDANDPSEGSVTWRPRQGLGVKLAAWAILALIGLGLAAMIAMLAMRRS